MLALVTLFCILPLAAFASEPSGNVFLRIYKHFMQTNA